MIDLPVFYRRDEIVVQFDYKRVGYSMLPRRHGTVLLCVSEAKSQVDKLSDKSRVSHPTLFYCLHDAKLMQACVCH